MMRKKIFRMACTVLLVQVCVMPSYSYTPPDSSGASFVQLNRKPDGISLNKVWDYLNSRSVLDTMPPTLPKGLSLGEIKATGTVRFITIFRNMQKSYGDMITSEKNISFMDYPISNVGASNNGGFPMLELNLANSPISKFQFNVGYSFASSLTGQQSDLDAARTISSRQNLRFGGKWNTGPVRVGVDAGGILWTRISRLTMGQTEYRDNYFDRVPWDWYRNSFLRYEEYYSLSSNIGAESAGRSPLLGYITTAEILPLGVKVTGLYGRTNLNTVVANSITNFPSATYAARIEKSIFTRRVAGKLGFNYYKKEADMKRSMGVPDDIEISTGDFNLKIYKITFAGEVGHCRINNPALHNKTGMAYVFKTELDRSVTAYPISLEYYHINYNFASLDGSVMNSNKYVNVGGYGTEFIYDNMMLINVAQQVGQIANNRQGFSLRSEFNVKKLKVQVGLSASQELQNLHDTITFQHRVNSFSRSRFRPWFQAGGEYGRIKSVWLTTYETMTITDTVNDYKKGFSTIELFLKYKLKLFRKDLVILNFNTFNTVQPGFAPAFDNKAFVRLFFEDLTLAYRLGRKYNIVANWGMERVWGNARTQLSPDNGKPIDQTGYAIGGGIDYDFSDNAGIHLRHKYMTHSDKNFSLDTFRGHETTLELKIFF